MERGISSISLNPDTVVPTWQKLGSAARGAVGVSPLEGARR
jgi:hypothetical protein